MPSFALRLKQTTPLTECNLWYASLCVGILTIFIEKAALFSLAHTKTCTHAASSVTRRKETLGEASHLTGIQLSMSNGEHPGEQESEANQH